MQLNKNIKLVRELSGKKQVDFADAIGTNLSNLKTYETTDVKPKANVLSKIADIAGISIDDIENRKLTHKDIKIDFSRIKKVKKVDSRGTSTLVSEDEPGTYKEKYIRLLEKENAEKQKLIEASLNELILGNRISQAHLKALLQITVVETAVMQNKDPVQALSDANKVVAGNFSAFSKTDSQPGM